MEGKSLKEYLVQRVLPRVQMPAQYMGGELNMVVKDPRAVHGRLCLAFPDAYTIGMSHHGFQVLYNLMNSLDGWYCERVFAPQMDMEARLRAAKLPLYSLETYTPLANFDVLGFSLQYEMSYTNILTMLDLGGIPLHADQRGADVPLVIAGGPCAQNPEPLAPFIDAFVTGDGESSLPQICDVWKELQQSTGNALGGTGGLSTSGNSAPNELQQSTGSVRSTSHEARTEMLAELAKRLPFVYVPRFYAPEYDGGRMVALNRTRPDVPEAIAPSLVADLDSIPLPVRPVVPYVECVHDRISIEIMRGCPWQCRFCQSTAIKRPLRVRSVESIVSAALETYRNTGYNEISLLSLSSSDYPHFEQLVRQLQEAFGPLGVNISVPSLRVNDELRTIAQLLGNRRRSSLTLAPEVARDDMREQIRKKIKNEDLYEGCRTAFRNNYEGVKLYFMCGLPGERAVDLDGIIEMAETIARISKEERGRFGKVTASVSNFVPKAHTPYQWNAMQTRDYFRWAHGYLRDKKRLRCVQLKCHSIETSLLEGVFSRGDRRMASAIERAWRAGARMDGWREYFDAGRWWQALDESGIDYEQALHTPYGVEDCLPWDHVNVKYGRPFLEKEQGRSTVQLEAMADAP